MKCPHCEYVQGRIGEQGVIVIINGNCGDFYKLPVKLEQTVLYGLYSANLFGCPRCKKTFISE